MTKKTLTTGLRQVNGMLRNGDFGELKKNTKKKKEPQVDLLKRKIASLGDDSLKQVKKKKKTY